MGPLNWANTAIGLRRTDLSPRGHSEEIQSQSGTLLEAWHAFEEGGVCFQDDCQKLVNVGLVFGLCLI